MSVTSERSVLGACGKPLVVNGCRCGEMADAQDLKSWGLKKPCGFESHHRHQTLSYDSATRIEELLNVNQKSVP